MPDLLRMDMMESRNKLSEMLLWIQSFRLLVSPNSSLPGRLFVYQGILPPNSVQPILNQKHLNFPLVLSGYSPP